MLEGTGARVLEPRFCLPPALWLLACKPAGPCCPPPCDGNQDGGISRSLRVLLGEAMLIGLWPGEGSQ